MILPEIKEAIIDACEGNPGALTTMLALYEHDKIALARLLESDIRGPDIWRMYKDECEQKLDVMCEKLKGTQQ